MVHGFRYSLGVFKAFSDLHLKMSDRSVCNVAGLIQTSENGCIPVLSANYLLVLWYVAIRGRRKMS